MTIKTVTLPVVIHAQTERARQLAEHFLCDAAGALEKHSWAAEHPEVVAALIQAQTVSFQTLVTAEALREVRDVAGKLVSEVRDISISLERIEKSLDSIVSAVGALDRS